MGRSDPLVARAAEQGRGQADIPFPITDPERIPAKRYYDAEFYRLEGERLWPHVWQMACRVEQIPAIGDWIEYSNLGKSVIVVRTPEGVKAFHNACRHRGVQLAVGHGNCRREGFICPFHGWRWTMQGQNSFVYGKHIFGEEQLAPDDLALPQCRVEQWGGSVFVNFDADAPGLRESLGERGRQLEKYNIDKLRAEWWYATVLPANWKIAMEAFMEGFHTLRTHPQLHAASPALFNAMYGKDTGGLASAHNPHATLRENIDAQIELMERLSVGMAGMCHAKDVETARGLSDTDLPDDPDAAMAEWFMRLARQVTEDGRARGEATPDLAALSTSDPLNGVEYVFPHYFLLPFLSSFSAYRVRPLGPESCLFELWSLTQFPEGKEPAPVMTPVMLPHDSTQFPPIPQQDYANIPRQQVGLHAESFEFMRLSRSIEGLISNYQQLIDGYLSGAAPDRLAEATGTLVGNFDGPIRDMGF